MESEMTLQDVHELIGLFDQHQIEVIIDGGWGVDALLGEQTRPHLDLDIAMPHRYVNQARRLLEERGYHDVPRPDTRECNFVLGDDHGHLVDFHTYTFDSGGSLVFGVPYPPEALLGKGMISGSPVRCITPDWLVQFHTGYPLDENDFHDVRALCLRFSIKMPPEYDNFDNSGKLSSLQ